MRRPHLQVYESVVRDKAGQIRDMIFAKNVFYDETGRLAGVVGAYVDITERKQAEEEVRKSRAMLNLVLDTVPQSVFWKDPAGRYLGCNKAFALQVGLEDTRQVIGKTDYDLAWTREEAEAYRADDREVLETNRAKRHIIEPLRQADGTLLWIDTTKVPLVDETGQLFAVLGVYEDITARKRAEEALRASEAAMRLHSLVLDQIQDHVTITDLEGKITYVNQAEVELFGRSKQEIIGHSTEIYGEVAERGATQREIVAKTLQEGSWRGEIVNFGRDGSEHIMDCRTQIVRDEQGVAIALCGISTDVTERKDVEQRLRRQERLVAIGQLAADIAHDFSNLLATIIVYARLGQQVPDLPATTAKYLQIIAGEAGTATHLIRQILDFGRSTEIERCPLDLSALIRNVIAVLQRTLSETIRIRLDLAPQPVLVKGDAGRLQQMLTNLALNARDAMPDGGTLSIGVTRVTVEPGAVPPLPEMWKTTRPSAWICLTVTDTGVGMTKEARAHLFEPFFTTKEKGKGTGLGLAQVYGIVQLHDGYIDVETEVRQGVTFRIYLPAAEAVSGESVDISTIATS